ncbi:hypothetical protein EC957_006711 [Mortierella hygrophila]|uniref:Uncharacterized protein n=1 Tax=Mortierella hygrophila TaxID=979708 RepID=A0A9P6EYU3_9FUNG|nr:hypothetical protein EC957_006711 [Mortierella hygrophila]
MSSNKTNDGNCVQSMQHIPMAPLIPADSPIYLIPLSHNDEGNPYVSMQDVYVVLQYSGDIIIFKDEYQKSPVLIQGDHGVSPGPSASVGGQSQRGSQRDDELRGMVSDLEEWRDESRARDLQRYHTVSQVLTETAYLNQCNQNLQRDNQELQRQLHTLQQDNQALRQDNQAFYQDIYSFREANKNLVQGNHDLQQENQTIHQNLRDLRNLNQLREQEICDLRNQNVNLRHREGVGFASGASDIESPIPGTSPTLPPQSVDAFGEDDPTSAAAATLVTVSQGQSRVLGEHGSPDAPRSSSSQSLSPAATRVSEFVESDNMDPYNSGARDYRVHSWVQEIDEGGYTPHAEYEDEEEDEQREGEEVEERKYYELEEGEVEGEEYEESEDEQ